MTSTTITTDDEREYHAQRHQEALARIREVDLDNVPAVLSTGDKARLRAALANAPAGVVDHRLSSYTNASNAAGITFIQVAEQILTLGEALGEQMRRASAAEREVSRLKAQRQTVREFLGTAGEDE